MGKILNKAKNVGKNYYFYFTLYWIGLIGTSIITIARYDIIAQSLNFDNWYEALILLGLIWSLPILTYTFLQKITRTLAISVSGIIFVVITIIYWFSTSGVETFVEEVKIALIPFLFLFVLYSGFIIGVKGAKKIR
jgi:hypothetical protein